MTEAMFKQKLRKLIDRLEAIEDHWEIDARELAEARIELEMLWEEQFKPRGLRPKSKKSGNKVNMKRTKRRKKEKKKKR